MKCHSCSKKISKGKFLLMGHKKICINCYNKREKKLHKSPSFKWLEKIKHDTPVIFASLALISSFFIPIGGLIFGLLELNIV